MSFFKIINTRLNTNIKPFITNGTFRYSHRHSLTNIPMYTIPNYKIPTNKIIINLLGEQKSVDTASWEIKSFAYERSLHTANIVYDTTILNHFLLKKINLQFIVNRCYNMSCQNLLYLNHDIINSNINDCWKPYNLYVMPHATNRFTTCNFIRNCNHSNIIVYPLAASEEIKRRDINILIN
jgi:uncharacterized membrane protein YcgQ (UPF0703/DUF1980 family)